MACKESSGVWSQPCFEGSQKWIILVNSVIIFLMYLALCIFALANTY